VEPKGPSSDEANLRVERLDESVGETVLNGGDDRRTVFTYSSSESNEGCDATALRLGHPAVQCGDGAGS
jgi:hypothetical protein